ncbi:hypothetical protein ACFOWX_11955 [Sphingorhabdus arenilitoris]|uniref:Uncharacterized protein n=1 Tax=Sphingorhabdus arenilitoris TaxID=1490041 RepID=A0ABV8RIR4_9SPHN
MRLGKSNYLLTSLSIICLTAPAAFAQNQFALPAEGAAYADVADLVTISPMILDATVKKVQKLSAEQSVGVPQNIQRTVIIADINALIRGTKGVAGQVRFLLDIPKDARGKIPKLKKQRFFILGKSVNGRPDMIQLSRPDALVSYSEANNALLRGITQEAVKLDAPPAVLGVSSAFYSPGTVIGEGISQIFLRTAGNQPFSISVASRPGQSKIWSVSTSELIEEGAATPRRNTLLWYRLACGLPRSLDSSLIEANEGERAAKAQADYQYVIDALGPCGRTRS